MARYLILVLRRDPADLERLEVAELQRCFPKGSAFEWQRSDPKDYREHAEDCRRLKPAAVILPMERPIPSVAMEEGFAHVAFLPNGTVGKLEPLAPKFTNFKVV